MLVSFPFLFFFAAPETPHCTFRRPPEVWPVDTVISIATIYNKRQGPNN